MAGIYLSRYCLQYFTKRSKKTYFVSGKNKINLFNQGGSFMRNEVVEKIAALVTAAFGLVAALAWNGAIQAIFKKVFGTAEGIVPMLVYAVVVTIIAVVATVWVGKAAERAKKKE
jgi:hypothetical protein